MVDHVREDGAGVFMVAAELGTAVVVGEGDNRVDTPHPAGHLAAKALGDLFGDAVDAAHRREDPDLVPDPDLAVRPPEAAEGPQLRRRGDLDEGGVVPVVEESLEVGFDAAVVDQGAGRRVPGHMPDREAVLDDVFARGQVPQDHLVAPRNVRTEHDAFDRFTRPEVLQGHRDVVGRVDFDIFH